MSGRLMCARATTHLLVVEVEVEGDIPGSLASSIIFLNSDHRPLMLMCHPSIIHVLQFLLVSTIGLSRSLCVCTDTPPSIIV